MGLTTLALRVANPARPRVSRRVEFLIDSGAVYSVVPATTLERLGVKPSGERTFTLANGERIARRTGNALFIYGKEVGASPVVFGERGDGTLLGAVTLEALGLVLDPIRRVLLPLPMLLAGGYPRP